jgi:hypothetical protein
LRTRFRATRSRRPTEDGVRGGSSPRWVPAGVAPEPLGTRLGHRSAGLLGVPTRGTALLATDGVDGPVALALPRTKWWRRVYDRRVTESESHPPTPLSIKLWFAWAFALLAVTGLLMGRIVEFIDFSERAPFSLLGIFMMVELAVVLFGITVALQRKRIGHRFAIVIALLAVPILAGLPPVLLEMPAQAANGWYVLTVPIGIVISVGLVIALLRPAARAYFSEP